MHLINNIAAFVLGVIFMASSSGIVVYQSHCICTGNDQVSLYVLPENCEDELENHSHHSHCETSENSSCGLSGCENPSEDCGCESVQIKFFKLEDQVAQEKLRNTTFQPVHFELPVQASKMLFSFNDELVGLPKKYCSSPPKAVSAIDYLVFIQQLKIPASA
ncbi:MAG: hypothetical protein ACOCU7_07840 [Tangfeifania sp.]